MGEKVLSEQKVLSEHLAGDACDCPATAVKGETGKTLGEGGKLPFTAFTQGPSLPG